jgi:hypothetical protein
MLKVIVNRKRNKLEYPMIEHHSFQYRVHSKMRIRYVGDCCCQNIIYLAIAMNQLPCNEYFIGLNNIGNILQWSDGSNYDYNNWNSGKIVLLVFPVKYFLFI